MEQGEVGPLLAAIVSVDNLTAAWQRVRRNIRVAQRARSRGSDEQSLADFEADWTHQMETLAAELRTGRYQPLPPRQLLIAKPHGGQRTIGVLAIRDRVAQRAVHQVLEPLFDPTFLPCVYGCRPHIGAPHALLQVQYYRQQGKTWAVHSDIRNFFDGINHQILLGLLARRITERPVLALIAAWLRARVLDATAHGDADSWWQRGEAALEQAAEWGAQELARRSGTGGLYGAGLGLNGLDTEGEAPYEPAGYMRRQAWKGMAQDALLLALSSGRPALAGVRRAAPLLRRVVGGNPAAAAAVAVAGGAAAAASLAWRHHQQAQPAGALQGGALSPLLANVYLDPFDRAMTARGYTLVRYVDDFLLVGTSRAEVEAGLQEAQRLLGRLRLQLNPTKTAVCAPEAELAFLGQTFAPLPTAAGPRWGSFQAAGAALRARGAALRLGRGRAGAPRPPAKEGSGG